MQRKINFTIEKTKKYRTGVVMLLYLVQHSRPDIENALRELSKVADGATEEKDGFSMENYGLEN